MANGKLNIQEWEDSQLPNKYTVPTTADWLTLKGPNQSADIIVDDIDPNASTNYDAAAIGSLYIWNKAGDVRLFIKTTTTVWVVVGLQT